MGRAGEEEESLEMGVQGQLGPPASEPQGCPLKKTRLAVLSGGLHSHEDTV